MRKRQDSKRENHRQEIIAVATRLMSKKGYKAASVEEIASRVGIHKSTFFHYFKNKELVLLEVLRIAIEDVTTDLNKILDKENVAPSEKLRQAIYNHLDSLARHIDNVNVYHSEIRFLSQKNRHEYLNTRRHYARCFEQLVRELKESNPEYFRGLDSKMVTFGILGMCNWMVKWFKKSGSFSTEDVANIFYQMITQRGDF
jgi:AcrR family transcriptional regulator